YYEATLSTSGCIQIGWADAAFSGASERGDGVGDGPHSWAYDGWRQMKWHGNSSSYGIKWKSGDVIGCGVDCDAGLLFFTLNGQYMGVAFQYVGEEYFDCRYFAKDLKATAGSTTTSRVKPSTVDPTSDFAELTRSLAILHCRRLLLTILAASRSSNLLNDVPTELVGTFLKLVASYTSPASTVSDLFKAVGTMSPRLEVSLVQCIDDQIRMASRRKYAKIHWDCGVEAIVTSQLSTLHCSDGGMLPSVWHDSHVLAHPNVGLAEYLTTLLASKQPAPLVQAWSYALRSPSMTLKEKAFRILSGLVPHVPESALACIPTTRLHAMTVARLTKEAIHFPIASKYLQSLMELTSTLVVQSTCTTCILSTDHNNQRRIAHAIKTQHELDQLPYNVVQVGNTSTSCPPLVVPVLTREDDDDDDEMSSEDQNAAMSSSAAPMTAAAESRSPATGPPISASFLTPAQHQIIVAAQHGFKVLDDETPHGFDLGVLSDEASQYWSGQLSQHELLPLTTVPPVEKEEDEEIAAPPP
ncbi:hypothetical protein DYB31_010475, partial [Aphanomyces astaci]